MSTAASDLIAVLGKASGEPEFKRVTSAHGLADVIDDPPSRSYVNAKKKGIGVMLEDDEVIDVQIYVQPTKMFGAYQEPLPFGLRAGMTQEQVHQVLGKADRFDEYDSHYLMSAENLKLTVVYDRSGVVRYLSVARPGRF